MNPYIYLRGLRHVDLSVFCVESGQKYYWDPLFNNVRVPYSSGQQVKRSILESVITELKEDPSCVTFVFQMGKKETLEEREVLSMCDPQYYDQIFGGWMSISAGGKTKGLKRRSPFSISAMRPLHPLLGGIVKENISFDRSDRPNIHKVIVKDARGNEMSEEEIEDKLAGSDRSLYRKWIPDNTRATGLFVYDIAIDLRRLFSVSTNQLEPEITKEKVAELKENGWVEAENDFGQCLVMPKEKREKAIPAIAKALINWKITSNQARTFSLMETLALAIDGNANKVAGAIRAKLTEEGERNRAKPVLDEKAGADLFVTLPCSGYVVTETESATAIEDAEKKLVEMMMNFDYENQK